MLCLASFVGMQAKEEENDSVYMMVDELATYKGGDQALYKWLGEHMQYPPKLQKAGVQGRVLVSFVVNKDGSLSDFKVAKSSGNEELDEHSLKLVKKIPKKFKPAKVGGEDVRMLMNLPLMWRLTR